MKKLMMLAVVLVAMVLMVSSSYAQYEKGKSVLGPRLGIGVYGSGISFGAGYEYGVTNEISVGGLLDYYKYDWGYGWSYTYLIIGAQGNYHVGKLLEWEGKLDPFVGLVLAYDNVSVSSPAGYTLYSSSYDSGILFGAQAGLRYFLSPNLALYGQVGFGITYLKVGVDFKF